MKTLGKPIFAKDAEGRLLSRIGTMFFKTPGLVTRRGVHAMQRSMWLDEVNAGRAAAGLAPLTPEEEDEELAQSVDLIFTEDHVLIRPDPEHMDLAFRADTELQSIVSKRRIRFLNTHSAKVRNALRARGENWRMARQPISQEDMTSLIERSRTSLSGEPIYYYNSATGTRYFTAGGVASLLKLEPAALRAQLREAQTMMSRRNRIGHPEIDLFPVTTPIDVKKRIKALDLDTLSDAELTASVRSIDADWRMSVPPELRDESVSNFDWRNEMCRVLTLCPNDSSAEEGELVQGISPEFYRQIEWLPGATVEDGEIVFDPLWDEYARTRDPELEELCDPRARNILFNLSRLFGETEYVNVGRIARSLARKPIEGSRRGSVYIIQYKERGTDRVRVYMLRFQKWGIAEHLDEGKDLLRSMLEANEYSDYILDRRLMCMQLGMALPPHIVAGQFTEPYRGHNQYNGVTVRAYYYARGYICGTASDKVPPAKFRNPAYAIRFAELMGAAAATDLVVGRRATETGENLFDNNYEVVQNGPDGLPARIMVTDHAGTFVNYLEPLAESVVPYANVVRRRASFVPDVKSFAAAFVGAFRTRLAEMREKYRARRRAFDELFVHRPYDAGGSGAYRWAKTLERLDACDPDTVAAKLAGAIEA